MPEDRPANDNLIEFVRKAHGDQTDKNGRNYVETHLLPVARSVPDRLFYPALAHDILEDTKVTVDGLRDAGFTEQDIARSNY